MDNVNSSDNAFCEAEDRLRRKLKYYFMNPCEKFKAKRKFPWKLSLQIFKLFLVTLQLVLFGVFRSEHIGFLEKTIISFKHLYLKGWNPSYETMPYPPAMGTFAVYTKQEFYDSVNFASSQYAQTQSIAIGTYSFAEHNDSMRPIEMCKKYYKKGKIFAFNQTFIFDSTIINDCFPVHPVNKNGVESYDIEEYLKQINKSINFDRLLHVSLSFAVKTVHLKTLSKNDAPDCFKFNIEIMYDNEGHNGQMPVKLVSSEELLDCHANIIYENDENLISVLISLFDSVVVVICILSGFLCIRSIIRSMYLMKVTSHFFWCHYSRRLTPSDKMEFVNMWYILIIFNDLLTIIGCIYKIQIENKVSLDYGTCSMLLGIANMLVWFGVLRYLGFFRKYNVLLLTLRTSAPNVLRFLICAAVFYIAFVICGWVVLGPYHIKFRELSTASECLFSLINGDDIFTTFATTSDDRGYIWWYCRIYLYIFISLFIYVVLSVFIAVIMDTYDTIKHGYQHGFPKTFLQDFADRCEDDASHLFSSRSSSCFTSCCFCFKRKMSVQSDDVIRRTFLSSLDD